MMPRMTRTMRTTRGMMTELDHMLVEDKVILRMCGPTKVLSYLKSDQNNPSRIIGVCIGARLG